jgi:hypothetical protein
MRCHKIFFSALLYLSASSIIYGQDSLAFKLQQDNLSTMNDLNIDQRLDLGWATLDVRDVLRYKLYDHDNNRGDAEQYSIEHNLRSDLLLFSKRKSSIRLESNQYQDHRTGLRSSISNWAILGGYALSREQRFFLGARSVKRYGLEDQGLTGALQGRYNWRGNSQSINLNYLGEKDQLKAHQNHHLQLSGDYVIRFGSVSTYQTSIRVDNRRQQFFTDSLGSSQLRENGHIVWNNNFSYNFNKKLKLTHDLNWGDQLTNIDREKFNRTQATQNTQESRKRLVLSNETRLLTSSDDFSSQSSFKVENSQHKFYVDHSQVLYQISNEANYHPEQGIDTLSWKNTLSRQEYDTPDTNNDDDRDEWRFKTELSLIYQPSPFSRLEIGSKLSLFHLIYLYGTRSAENYWNRNLVLWTEYDWLLNDWSGKAKAHIRSNYFDYDYDALFIEMDQPARSFVHRSLDLSKRLQYRFSPRWYLSTQIASRWEDEGQLDWSKFIQQITSQRQQTEVIAKLAFEYRGWVGWIGFLKHQRKTTYSAITREAVIWEGEGPLFGIRHALGNRLSLNLDGRVITVLDGDREYLLPKIFFSLVYR